MPTPFDTTSTLHSRIADAASGDAAAAEIDNRAGVSALSAGLRRCQLVHARELADLLLAHGGRADADGSFMSAVHKAALNVRVALGADDAETLTRQREFHEVSVANTGTVGGLKKSAR